MISHDGAKKDMRIGWNSTAVSSRRRFVLRQFQAEKEQEHFREPLSKNENSARWALLWTLDTSDFGLAGRPGQPTIRCAGSACGARIAERRAKRREKGCSKTARGEEARGCWRASPAQTGRCAWAPPFLAVLETSRGRLLLFYLLACLR